MEYILTLWALLDWMRHSKLGWWSLSNSSGTHHWW